MHMTNGSPQHVFAEVTQGLSHFPDGRIDYSHAQKAPVLNVVVYVGGEILLVKRSSKVGAYQGLWNGISGYIDEQKSVEDFAKQELREELSLLDTLFEKILVANPYEVHDKSIHKTWVVFPVLVTLPAKPVIALDWEHTDYVWIRPEQLQEFSYVKDFDVSVRKAIELLPS